MKDFEGPSPTIPCARISWSFTASSRVPLQGVPAIAQTATHNKSQYERAKAQHQ